MTVKALEHGNHVDTLGPADAQVLSDRVQCGQGLGERVALLPQREHLRALGLELLSCGVAELKLQPAGGAHEGAAQRRVGVAASEEQVLDAATRGRRAGSGRRLGSFVRRIRSGRRRRRHVARRRRGRNWRTATPVVPGSVASPGRRRACGVLPRPDPRLEPASRPTSSSRPDTGVEAGTRRAPQRRTPHSHRPRWIQIDPTPSAVPGVPGAAPRMEAINAGWLKNLRHTAGPGWPLGLESVNEAQTPA